MLKDFTTAVVRASAILTGSYVAGTLLKDVEQFNQLQLEIDYTPGSLTNADLKIEFSDDNVTFRQETQNVLDASTGISTPILVTHRYTGVGPWRIETSIGCRYIKISVLGNGTATNSLMAIKAFLTQI